MRNIIFRAKRTDTGEWVYGDLQYVQLNTKIEEVEEAAEERILLSYSAVSIANCNVVEKTIGQDTGVNDKFGCSIFEGDILLHLTSVERYWIVEYKDGAFCVCRNGDIYIPLMDVMLLNIYVIGNIHDNPELLTE